MFPAVDKTMAWPPVPLPFVCRCASDTSGNTRAPSPAHSDHAIPSVRCGFPKVWIVRGWLRFAN